MAKSDREFVLTSDCLVIWFMELWPNIWLWLGPVDNICNIFLFASLTAHEKKKNGLPATECLRKLCLPPVAGHNAKLSCVQIHFFAVSRTLLFHSFCQMQTKPITKSTQPGNQQNWAIRGTCKVWLANNCNLLSQEPSKAQTMSVSMWPA